eukprot:scaffold2738_cov366-Prasinococcus_capsulatus_cf.AAC.6
MNEGNGITTLAAFVPALERKAATPCRAAGSESASRNNKKARCEDSRGKTGDSASLHWPPLKPLPNESASDAKARHEACSQLTVKLQAQMETIIFRQCHLVGRSITNFVVSEFEEYQGRFLRMAVEDDGVENCKISSGQLPTGIILSDCPNQDTSLSLTSIVASLRTAGCICAHFRAREYGAVSQDSPRTAPCADAGFAQPAVAYSLSVAVRGQRWAHLLRVCCSNTLGQRKGSL